MGYLPDSGMVNKDRSRVQCGLRDRDGVYKTKGGLLRDSEYVIQIAEDFLFVQGISPPPVWSMSRMPSSDWGDHGEPAKGSSHPTSSTGAAMRSLLEVGSGKELMPVRMEAPQNVLLLPDPSMVQEHLCSR